MNAAADQKPVLASVRYHMGELRGHPDHRWCIKQIIDKVHEAALWCAANDFVVEPIVIDGETLEYRFLDYQAATSFVATFKGAVLVANNATETAAPLSPQAVPGIVERVRNYFRWK